jgi:hypothetical protein
MLIPLLIYTPTPLHFLEGGWRLLQQHFLGFTAFSYGLATIIIAKKNRKKPNHYNCISLHYYENISFQSYL